MGQLDLAFRLAGAERSRLQRRAHAIGADDSLVPHLAACIMASPNRHGRA